MPDLRPHLLTSLAGLLSLATAALWIQSHVAPRNFNLTTAARLQLSSAAGQAYVLANGPLRPGTIFGGGSSGSRNALIAGHHAVARLSAVEYYPNATTVRAGYLLAIPYTTLLPLALATTTLAHLLDRRRRIRGPGFPLHPEPPSATNRPEPAAHPTSESSH